ncbi:MAG TPA: hypothetical protein VG890_07100 [Puia sp.]|nr:hypothetical protein [Puia sp.]
MKKIRYLLAVAATLLLAGCFEIQEQIDIQSNGSGELTVNTDMSQLLVAMQNYLGAEEMQKQMPVGKTLDTTVLMKDLMDSMKNATPESKALVQDGKLHMKLDMDQKVFKSDMHIPFSSQENLQKLYNSMNNQNLGFSQLFKGMSGKSDATDGDMPDMNQFNAIYDFKSHDGLISRKLNADKWKALQQDPQFSQLKEAGNSGINIPYTLTINLPRPVKKVDNELAKLSADKKQVVIQYNLIEVFQHPEKFEYTIVY